MSKEIFQSYINDSHDITNISLNETILKDIAFITTRIATNKGVCTVLVTLAVYKVLNPNQDIRKHQDSMVDGFSGRSFDTKYITPVLATNGFNAMSESGWLTRSLEQPLPYDKDYPGKINPPDLKKAFLNLVEEINQSKENAEKILQVLLHGYIKHAEINKIVIHRIENNDIEISKLIFLLRQHFEYRYLNHGASKLPMLAFYAMYFILVKEMERYAGTQLKDLGSHTAPDDNSNSAGDVEVIKGEIVFEAVEVKLDKPITPQFLMVALKKIQKFKIQRYYILSGKPPKPEDIDEINSLIFEIDQKYGCHVIVNGLYETLKYYLRLISNVQEFLNKYIELVEGDSELNLNHKQKLSELIVLLFKS